MIGRWFCHINLNIIILGTKLVQPYMALVIVFIGGNTKNMMEIIISLREYDITP